MQKGTNILESTHWTGSNSATVPVTCVCVGGWVHAIRMTYEENLMSCLNKLKY